MGNKEPIKKPYISPKVLLASWQKHTQQNQNLSHRLLSPMLSSAYLSTHHSATHIALKVISLVAVSSFGSFGMMGCKGGLLNPQNTEHIHNTKLSGLRSNNYHFYLTKHHKHLQSYQFVVCDSSISENEPVQANSQLPKQCVPAFRSSPASELCQLYEYYKVNCPRGDTLRTYCANYIQDPSTPAPANFNPAECPMLFAFGTLGQCRSIIDPLKDSCENLKTATKACETSPSPFSQSCKDYEKISQERHPFLLRDFSLHPEQTHIMSEQLRYESFLIFKEKQASQRWQAFLSGASFGVFSPIMAGHLRKLVPNRKIFTSGPKLFIRGGPKVNIQNIFVLSSEIAGYAALDGNAIQQLYNYFGYSSGSACMASLIQQIPKPVTESTPSAWNVVKRGAPPLALGATLASVIAKTTSNMHPAVNIGAITAFPFFVGLYVKGQHSNTAPLSIMKYYKDITTPTDTAGSDANTFPKVKNIETLIPVLGRSMLITNKASHFALSEYCMPKKTGDTFEPFCRPLLQKDHALLPTGDENSLTSAKNSIDCSDALAPWLSKMGGG